MLGGSFSKEGEKKRSYRLGQDANADADAVAGVDGMDAIMSCFQVEAIAVCVCLLVCVLCVCVCAPCVCACVLVVPVAVLLRVES